MATKVSEIQNASPAAMDIAHRIEQNFGPAAFDPQRGPEIVSEVVASLLSISGGSGVEYLSNLRAAMA